MSLENNLKRIADALEELVKTVQQDINPVITTAAPVAVTTAPEQYVNDMAKGQEAVAAAPAPAAAAAPAPAPAAPAPPAPPAPAAPAAALPPEEINAKLVAEFKRLGSRDGIDKAMSDLGVSSVAEMTAEQQQSLLNAVAVLQP